MKPNLYFATAFYLFLISCAVTKNHRLPELYSCRSDSIHLFDQSRGRPVPVALYYPDTMQIKKPLQVIIFSHGYGGNRGGDYTAYSYLTKYLATHGYFVASIQHELPTDELLPLTGNPQETRRPNWERGAQNILFVLNELKKAYPALDYQHVTLVGHSNGGDMSMLFAHKYPELIDKIISLDNRRMPFPRTAKPKIYSLRSSDQPADEGVVPTVAEQQKFGMKVIKLRHTTHNQMDDSGNEAQHKEINRYVLYFLAL